MGDLLIIFDQKDVYDFDGWIALVHENFSVVIKFRIQKEAPLTDEEFKRCLRDLLASFHVRRSYNLYRSGGRAGCHCFDVIFLLLCRM